MSSAVLVNRDLEKPERGGILKNSETKPGRLQALLDQKKNSEFYIEAYKDLRQINELSKENASFSKEQQVNAMWLFYLVANTPFLSCQTSDEANDEAVNSGEDIKTKKYLMGILMHPCFDPCFPEGMEYKKMRVSYAVTLLKEMRQASRGLPDADTIAYRTIEAEKKLMASHSERRIQMTNQANKTLPYQFDPAEWKYVQQHPEDKEAVEKFQREARACKEWSDKENDNIKEEWRETMRLRSFLLLKSRRDMDMARVLPRMEKDYMVMLVRFYPGKAAEVRKWIKEAGYSNQEMYDLIDRTVGRTPKTEFLYKGTNRKRGL